MQPISVRLPEDDWDWLVSLNIEGCSTLSDKVRGLITRAHRQDEGASDFVSAASQMRDLLRPFVDALRGAEHKVRIHSEVLARVCDQVPEIMAAVIAARPSGKDPRASLVEIEAEVVRRALQLLVSLARLAVTPNIPAYDPQVMRPHLLELINITKLIEQQHFTEGVT